MAARVEVDVPRVGDGCEADAWRVFDADVGWLGGEVVEAGGPVGEGDRLGGATGEPEKVASPDEFDESVDRGVAELVQPASTSTAAIMADAKRCGTASP